MIKFSAASRDMRRLTILIIPFLISSGSWTYADYQVTGAIFGTECTSFIIFDRCKDRHVDATLGQDNQYYSLAQSFPDVSEFNESSGICHIKTPSPSWITKVLGRAKNYPVFFEKQVDGKYEQVDVEYLTFPCRKTDAKQ